MEHTRGSNPSFCDVAGLALEEWVMRGVVEWSFGVESTIRRESPKTRAHSKEKKKVLIQRASDQVRQIAQ